MHDERATKTTAAESGKTSSPPTWLAFTMQHHPRHSVPPFSDRCRPHRFVHRRVYGRADGPSEVCFAFVLRRTYFIGLQRYDNGSQITTTAFTSASLSLFFDWPTQRPIRSITELTSRQVHVRKYQVSHGTDAKRITLFGRPDVKWKGEERGGDFPKACNKYGGVKRNSPTVNFS